MEIVGLFVGETKSPEFYDKLLASKINDEPRKWPEKEHCSAFLKDAVDRITITFESGIVGNGIGFPTHIANAEFRTALVQHMGVYDDIDTCIPGSKNLMIPGCFGENITFKHPSLHPSEVCIGDVYSVNSSTEESEMKKKVIFRVTGPRMPCPKVDAFLGVNGVTALGRKTAWTGYFFQIVEEGECCVGDKLELINRPYPGLTMTKIQESLWGDIEQQDHSQTFLETLASIDCLIPRHYRETAAQRLERLR